MNHRYFFLVLPAVIVLLACCSCRVSPNQIANSTVNSMISEPNPTGSEPAHTQENHSTERQDEIPQLYFPEAAVPISSLEAASAYEKETAIQKQETLLGLTMEVPGDISSDLICNKVGNALFSFYDGETQAVSDMDGWVWSIAVYENEEYEKCFQVDPGVWTEGQLSPNAMPFARDPLHQYLLSFPSDVRFASTCRESYFQHYLLGYAMLQDFLKRNNLEASPYWEPLYIEIIASHSISIGSYDTIEFGLGDLSTADDTLLQWSNQIANLAEYDGAYALTWNDALVFRLLTVYAASTPTPSEDQFLGVRRNFVPYFAWDYTEYYGDPALLEPLAALDLLYQKLKGFPDLAEICQAVDLHLTENDGVWRLTWNDRYIEVTTNALSSP